MQAKNGLFISAEEIYTVMEGDKKMSNRGIFKSVTSVVSSCLLQMGEDSLVFQILEEVILDQMVS